MHRYGEKQALAGVTKSRTHEMHINTRAKRRARVVASASAAAGLGPAAAAAAATTEPQTEQAGSAAAKARRAAAALLAGAAAVDLGCLSMSVQTRESYHSPTETNTDTEGAASVQGKQQQPRQQTLRQLHPLPFPEQEQRRPQENQQQTQHKGPQLQQQPLNPNDVSGPTSLLSGLHHVTQGAPGTLSPRGLSRAQRKGSSPSGPPIKEECDWTNCLQLLEEVWGVRGAAPFELYRHLRIEPNATCAEIRKVRRLLSFQSAAPDCDSGEEARGLIDKRRSFVGT